MIMGIAVHCPHVHCVDKVMYKCNVSQYRSFPALFQQQCLMFFHKKCGLFRASMLCI